MTAGAERFYDLAVVGAGAAGIGAALSAARLGLSVALIEAADVIGGTGVRGGVCVWSPGVGGTGIPFDIYRRLRALPGAVSVTTIGRHLLYDGAAGEPPFPGGEAVADAGRGYHDSLRRHGARSMREDEAFCREQWHGVLFEPAALVHVVREMLSEGGRCETFVGAACEGARVRGGHVESVALRGGRVVRAGHFVDATGDAVLSRLAGATVRLGQDGRGEFGEPDAPEWPTGHINGVSQIYRVTPAPGNGIEPLPDGIGADCWWAGRFPSASVDRYASGDYLVNMLPTLGGEEWLALGDGAEDEARRRARAHWHHCQTVFPEFRDYRLLTFFPALGVRESYRVRTEYVLNENDLLRGIDRQWHEDIVALADHAMDTHGAETGRTGCGELDHPYGIPFRCLLPLGFDNLMVAGRCAGFSSIAASSCRVTRTMMQLGQAAGTAAWVGRELGAALREIPARALRQALEGQHVQLAWPMREDLERYILENE